MGKACWCYTTDAGYLLPSLVSASQLKRSLGSRSDSVIIVYFGPNEPLTVAAQAAAKAEGLVFISVGFDEIKDAPMICARLHLDAILDPTYDTITYLDGDTQVPGDVGPLADAKPRAGGLMAAPDLMALMAGHRKEVWQRRAAYFEMIGINPEQRRRYFNSGILRAQRADWAAISRECLALLAKPAAVGYRFRDQDALNIVLGGRQELISLRWNFPGFFLGRGLSDLVRPRVIHFMSNPRPWDGAFPAWGVDGHKPYRDFVIAYPDLARLFRPLAGARKFRYHLQQRVKGVLEDWDGADIRARITDAEEACRKLGH